MGNIYASEALFLAGIRPTTPAAGIGMVRARRLYEAIRQVMERAVAQGGSTLRNFSSADGSAGHFQREAHVYGRAGAPCHTCGTLVRMERQGSAAAFCPGASVHEALKPRNLVSRPFWGVRCYILCLSVGRPSIELREQSGTFIQRAI